MAEIRVTSHVQFRDEFGRFALAIHEGAEAAIVQAAQRGAFLAAVLAPKRTFRLAGSIEPFAGGMQGGWTVSTPYAMAQEKGAGPHPIGAPGQVLAGDGFGPVRGPVMHPGNPAVHYMKRSYDIVSKELLSILRRNMP